jgi:hypothetical protein
MENNTDLENLDQYIANQLLDNKTIKGYGKAGHGMNGKDADLDDVGQCTVEDIFIVDTVDSDTMFIELHINRYASICSPTDDDEDKEEFMVDAAECIVMSATEYRGEWTGSDYWSFSTEETIRVPLEVEEYENPNLEVLSQRCADAIYNSDEGKDFEEFCTSLNKAIEDLQQLSIEDLRGD